MNRQSDKPRILRSVPLHPQALELPRPTRVAAVPAQREPVPDAEAAAVDMRRAYEEAHRSGHAEGRQAGLQEGRAEGLRIGEAAGKKAAQQAVAQRIAALDGLLAALERQTEMQWRLLEDDAVEAVFSAVCRILGERALSQESAGEAVRAVLAQMRGRTVLTVRAHPQDVEQLNANRDLADYLSQRQAKTEVKWLADERIELGGCILDSAEGSLDARLETQLSRLREVLLQTRRAREDEGAAS